MQTMTPTTEFLVISFIAAGLLLSVARRIVSGCKNAAFYGQQRHVQTLPGYIFRWIQNIHKLETPAWYAQFGAVACFMIAVALLVGKTVQEATVFGFAVTMFTSAMAGPLYQGPINQSVGRPFIDPGENPKSEFAWGRISVWWWRPWKGWRRVIGAVVGLAGNVAALIWLVRF